MERQFVCKVSDKFVEYAMMLVGFSQGKGKLILADRENDGLENVKDFDTILLPLYDANEYIRRRLPEYGAENK